MGPMIAIAPAVGWTSSAPEAGSLAASLAVAFFTRRWVAGAIILWLGWVASVATGHEVWQQFLADPALLLVALLSFPPFLLIARMELVPLSFICPRKATSDGRRHRRERLDRPLLEDRPYSRPPSTANGASA